MVYVEEFAPECFDRALLERSWWPLHERHRPGIIGFVEFHRTSDRLLFVATLDQSRQADTLWRLQQLGEWRAVSIQGDATGTAERRTPDSVPIVRRTAVTITELSICPNGHGQLPYARVEHLQHAQANEHTRSTWRLLDLHR
jgi:hypothetical protein